MLAALPSGCVVADLVVGKFYIEAGHYRGPCLPPFRAHENPQLKDWFHVRTMQLDGGQEFVNDRRLFDAELGWAPPFKRSETNPLDPLLLDGARGSRRYNKQRPDGVLRLAAFGESFIFGTGVDLEHIWSVELERQGQPMEVLNYGVPAYGLDQALLRYRKFQQGLNADVLVIGIHPEVIKRGLSRCTSWLLPSDRRISVKPRFRLSNGELHLVPLPYASERAFVQSALHGDLEASLGEHDHWLEDQPLLPFSNLSRIHAAYSAHKRRDVAALWNDTQGEGFQLVLALLEQFREEARSHGTRRILILIFPRKRDREIRDPEMGVLYLDPLREELTRREFEFIDLDRRLAPRMRHVTETTGRPVSGLFREGHFDEEGNRLVAAEVMGWLVDQGLQESRPANSADR